MLRKFKITIDGKEYLVEMEEIGGAPQAVAPAPQPTAEVQTPQPVAAPVEAPTPASDASVTAAGNEAMTSPMPGTILKILVNVGDSVKENQPLLILEAMKMENEVVAAKDGKVAGIHATIGQVVNAGDALITIE
jgi:biotin carboxyl carrier protein